MLQHYGASVVYEKMDSELITEVPSEKKCRKKVQFVRISLALLSLLFVCLATVGIVYLLAPYHRKLFLIF